MNDSERDIKRFEVSLQTRNFEIELFWKRALFFWGFISSAFIGYAALRQSELRILVACFGLVCSCAWSLVNRGSKYWQEVWESRVERFETPVIGSMFASEEGPQNKGYWFRGRTYSVSKLAIALSDYVFLFWLTIVIGEGVRPFLRANIHQRLREPLKEAFMVFSVLYVILLLVYGRKTPRRLSEKRRSK